MSRRLRKRRGEGLATPSVGAETLESEESAFSHVMTSRENSGMHSIEGYNAMDMLRFSDMLGGLSVEALETLAEEAKEVRFSRLI